MALGLDDDRYLADRAGVGSSMNVNWYPPRARAGPPIAGQWRIGPHTDFGTITVLDREPGLGGLQVELDDGTWVDAPWVPGSLVVNCGDLLTAWSNQRWRSAAHRVLPPAPAAPEESLVSLVYFCEPAAEVVVGPLPGLDEPGAFQPFAAGRVPPGQARRDLRQLSSGSFGVRVAGHRAGCVGLGLLGLAHRPGLDLGRVGLADHLLLGPAQRTPGHGGHDEASEPTGEVGGTGPDRLADPPDDRAAHRRGCR